MSLPSVLNSLNFSANSASRRMPLTAHLPFFRAYIICLNWLTDWKPDASGRSRDVCRDLGVDDGLCECTAVGEDECYARSPTYFTCGDKDVIQAMLEAATKPKSFMSHNGYDVKVGDVSDRNWPLSTQTGNMGGLLLPRLSNATL